MFLIALQELPHPERDPGLGGAVEGRIHPDQGLALSIISADDRQFGQ
jgi:hypothetical protein